MYDDDPLSVYLAALDDVQPLSRDQEAGRWQHIRAGDQQAETARKDLVEANLKLVVSIAQRYRNGPIPILFLIEKGNEGLMRAVDTFPDSEKKSFSAHAADQIERAIVEFIAAPRL